MRKLRHSEHDEVWRRNILDAARRVISAKGFHNVTMEDISKASLTPKSVLYRYFPNRDAIISEAYLDSSRQSLSILAAIVNQAGLGRGSARRVVELSEAIFSDPTFHLEIGRFNVDWWGWVSRNEIGLEGFRQTWREWRATLRSIVRSEVGPEAPNEIVDAIVNLMLALYNGVLLHATFEGDDVDVSAIISAYAIGLEGLLERIRAGERISADDGRKARKGQKDPNA